MSREMLPLAVFDSLPGELLVLIVSRLPFKEAARTSVLAKRWTHIWKHTTNVELNQNFFIKDDVCVLELFRQEGAMAVVPFAEFAAKFLNSYKGREICSFKLVVGKIAVVLGSVLYQFVKFAFFHKVKNLTIDMTRPIWNQSAELPYCPRPVIGMPRQFYQHCDRYESLHLRGVKILLSNCTNFAALRSVSLAWIKLEDDDVKNLVAESPCLEDLRLEKCWGFDVDIQSNSLKTLVVDKCNLDQDAVSVVAPKLKVFVYSGRFGDINFNDTVTNLEEVYIDFDMESDFNHYWTLIFEQFSQFKNVRVLQVCSYVLQIIPFIHSSLLPVDPKHLILKTAGFHPNDFCGFKYFLCSCKSIEVLTIDITERRLLNDYEDPLAMFMELDLDYIWGWIRGEPPAECECTAKTLKIVEVKEFSGTVDQIQYLLQIMYCGKELEKVVLFKKESAQQEAEEAYQLLLRSERASANLQIAFI
ncbi:hypothetical protein QQ045_010068 [Rhodiola kirilowii]